MHRKHLSFGQLLVLEVEPFVTSRISSEPRLGDPSSAEYFLLCQFVKVGKWELISNKPLNALDLRFPFVEGLVESLY